MSVHNCLLCKKEFHIVYQTSRIQASVVVCPYCGYSLKNINDVRRKKLREKVVNDCVLSAAFGLVSAQTVDVSESGFGIKINHKNLQFKKNDILNIGINNNAIKHTAQVVWLKMDESSSRIGLRIC